VCADPLKTGMAGMGGMGGPRKDPSLQSKLPTTLEEMYKGSTRKMKISRTVVDASSGKATRISEVLTINIKAGWKAGTKVRLELLYFGWFACVLHAELCCACNVVCCTVSGPMQGNSPGLMFC